jgi:hypothetical protein
MRLISFIILSRVGKFSIGCRKSTIVSVVGVPGWNETGIIAHALPLGNLGPGHRVAQAAAEYSVSFCIPAEQIVDTVRFLHKELGLEDKHDH